LPAAGCIDRAVASAQIAGYDTAGEQRDGSCRRIGQGEQRLFCLAG
jgi:hypothetical protein